MVDQPEKAIPAPLEALYDDPLRPGTARAGKTLVVVSLAAIMVARYGAKLAPSSVVPLTFQDRPDVLPTMLFWVLTILTVNFGLKIWTDWLRDKEVRLLITRHIENMRSGAAFGVAHAINAQIDAQEPDREMGGPALETWEEEAERTHAMAEARVKKAEEALGLRALPRLLRLIRISLESFVPLGLGIYGMLLAARQAFHS